MRKSTVLAGILAAGLLPAAPGRATDIHVGINIGVPPPPPPPMVVAEPPRLVVVPSTPVYYAPSVSYNFFYYDGLYYTLHAGSWFFAGSSAGPWTFVETRRVPRPILAVPVAYYKIPPGHMKKWHGRGHDDDDWDDDHGHRHGHGHGHGRGHDD